MTVSMGPRLFSRGYPGCRTPGLRRKRGFNGATAFQPWILAALSLIEKIQNRVSMGPRLFSRGYRPQYELERIVERMFQWGHGFSAVDTALGRRQWPVAERNPSQYCLSILVSVVWTPTPPGGQAASSVDICERSCWGRSTPERSQQSRSVGFDRQPLIPTGRAAG